ncbi:hypothetical protein MJO55_14615 [Mycolicibacterium rufum]|uniref:Secreted protein n=1 Tax=Mycolicibacterium rufum TaxID=318424 RepID=A0ABY3UA31_9MYCO|nr:hypothetical protein [Mycolicibacterium rufum]KGI68468.1 hypothetical protein EU78_14650 [Mycolicibacterium rufum]ULP34575.1 hypothetical protein MJO55_14615 [Mycolicibacterium rufum]
MRRIARAAVTATALMMATGPLLAGAGVASAESAVTVMPFQEKLRRCDFSQIKYVGGSYYGRATAQLRVEGGTVVADVTFFTGQPNTRYDVRLIQMPRASAAGCEAGAPGVASAALFTDGGGAGTVTVRGPIMPGATGAWLSLSRRASNSQQPEEFYTTSFIASL